MIGLTVAGVAILALYGGLFMLSMYSSPTLQHLIEILRNWQIFAAGFLAVVAGGLTVWGTWASAMRQVTAVETAAAQQVRAAERQTDAAQRQTEVMRKTERRRIAREAYAFFAMLHAAMVSIGDDVEAAQGFSQDIPQDGRMSAQAAAARRQIRKVGFDELRHACLRYGSEEVTPLLLQLDKEIDSFASSVTTVPSPVAGVPGSIIGNNDDLQAQLQSLSAQVKSLRREATFGITRCRDVLMRTDDAADFLI